MKKSITLVTLLGASSFAAMSPAMAQNSAVPSQDGPAPPLVSQQNSADLGDIVVTAQKRSERLQDVPIAVTALTEGDLAGANIDGQLALPKLTPNLNFTVLSTFAAAYIRGVGTQFANPGLEASVPVYFDDVYLPRATSAIFNFNDIERIEVLKGPQGTLYGRNATGGAVRIITRDPQLGILEGALNATYGTDNRVLVGGVLNVPLGNNVALRIAAQHDENDGYMRNQSPTGPRRQQRRNAEMYTGKLLWEPSDVLRVKLSADYERKKDNEGFGFKSLYRAPTQIGEVLGGCVGDSFYNLCNDSPLSIGNLTSYGFSGRIDYDAGPVTLSSITSHRHIDEFDGADLDGTSAPFQHSIGVTATNQFTQEFQAALNNGGPLQVIGGVFYLHEKSFYNYYVYGDAIDGGFGALGDAFGIGATNLLFTAQGPGLKVNSIAPYVQADYEVTDKLAVTVGARYTWEKKTLLGNDPGLAIRGDNFLPVPGSLLTGDILGAAAIPGIGGICAMVGDTLCRTDRESVNFRNFTPKLTISYKPVPELMLYATASRGFKAGGLSLPAFGFVDSVKPEVLDDLEGGWKYQSGPLRFNGSIFHYWYKNLQLPIVNSSTGTTNTRNAATARNYGIESDLVYKVTPDFEIGMGGGYLHARFSDFPDGPGFEPAIPVGGVTTVFPNLKGRKLPNAPEFTGYIRGQYNVPFGDGSELQLSSILNYRSTAYFDVANQFPDKKREMLSAKIQWFSADKKYTVGVYGENLTGRRYLTNITPLGNGGFVNVGPPRQVYATAGMKF